MQENNKTVSEFIKTVSTNKVALELRILEKVHDQIESYNRGPSSEVIDLIFSITGYGKADIPGGEVQVATQCVTALVKYFSLRAMSGTEPLEEALVELITETVRLYGEVNINRGVQVIVPLQKQGVKS
jgi:hypothetical protein